MKEKIVHGEKAILQQPDAKQPLEITTTVTESSICLEIGDHHLNSAQCHNLAGLLLRGFLMMILEQRLKDADFSGSPWMNHPMLASHWASQYVQGLLQELCFELAYSVVENPNGGVENPNGGVEVSMLVAVEHKLQAKKSALLAPGNENAPKIEKVIPVLSPFAIRPGGLIT